MASRPAAAMPDPPGARMPMNCGNWAALWPRHSTASIDQKSDSRALLTLARCSALFVSDGLRRVASFGNSAVLLLGIACGVALVIPWSVWLFFSRPRTSTPIHRLRHRCAHRSKPHPNCCYKRLHQLRLSTRCEHCTQLGRLARRL